MIYLLVDDTSWSPTSSCEADSYGMAHQYLISPEMDASPDGQLVGVYSLTDYLLKATHNGAHALPRAEAIALIYLLDRPPVAVLREGPVDHGYEPPVICTVCEANEEAF